MANTLKRIVVTSLNEKGYYQYGVNMIAKLTEFWPENIPLIVVSEDALPIINNDRVIFHDYNELAPEGEHFKRKFGGFSEANGNFVEFEETEEGSVATPIYNFRFDAIRFSHKVFSIFGVNRAYDCDELIWLDADTVSHKTIDDRFFDSVSPGEGHLSYLARGEGLSPYSECGFMVFNRRNRIHETFMAQLVQEYLNGDLFLLSQWHDCMIIDVVREHFARTEGIEYRNISGKGMNSEHPFINSILGEYMDHLKGPDRKEAGKSFDSDWVANDIPEDAPPSLGKKHPDISVIQNITGIETSPYPFAWTEEALPEHIYRELESSLPVDLIKSDGTYDIGGTNGDGGNYRYKSAAALTDRKIPNIWLEFFEYHTSEEYFRSVISLFERQIVEHYPQYLDLMHNGSVDVRGLSQHSDLVTDCQYVVHEPLEDQKTTRTPHLDNPIEIYAGLLYMKNPEDESTGGNFSVHEAIKPVTSINRATGREVDTEIHQLVAEIPYKRNSFAMFLNVLNSIHSVTPRQNAKLDRISINIIGEFNSENRMWNEG